MGRSWRNKTVTAGGYITLALMLLIFPVGWVFSWLAAAGWHEVCHLVAVWLCSGTVSSVQVGAHGARISAGELSRGRELICVLAGPLGALLLLPLAKWIPAIAVCAMIQSGFNLLPCRSLDGGKALECFAQWLLPSRWADRVCGVGVVIGCGVLILLALYLCVFCKLGVWPLIGGAVLIVKTNFRKTPCNQCGLGVQ